MTIIAANIWPNNKNLSLMETVLYKPFSLCKLMGKVLPIDQNWICLQEYTFPNQSSESWMCTECLSSHLSYLNSHVLLASASFNKLLFSCKRKLQYKVKRLINFRNFKCMVVPQLKHNCGFWGFFLVRFVERICLGKIQNQSGISNPQKSQILCIRDSQIVDKES